MHSKGNVHTCQSGHLPVCFPSAFFQLRGSAVHTSHWRTPSAPAVHRSPLPLLRDISLTTDHHPLAHIFTFIPVGGQIYCHLLGKVVSTLSPFPSFPFCLDPPRGGFLHHCREHLPQSAGTSTGGGFSWKLTKLMLQRPSLSQALSRP